MFDRDQLAAIAEEMTVIRHQIHQNPEAGFCETQTAAVICEVLARHHIHYRSGYGKTGIVATIEGKSGGREILLRCDMDAIALDETKNLPYRSQNKGLMHACGHDGHVAIMLGVATYLAAHNDFGGRVHLLFQPAEERFGGAREVIADGLFTDYPNIDAVYGLHNWPGIAVGKMASRPGALMACGGSWEMEITGSGGHGAMPHQTTDPTLAAGHIITAMQSIVSRNVSPVDSAVISIAYMNCGDSSVRNVIPAKVQLAGTCRAYKNEVHSYVFERLKEVAAHTAAAFGCEAQTEVKFGYPAVVNSDEKFAIATKAARATVGDNYDAAIEPVTPSEDFAYYLNHVPGAFVFLGNGDSAALHTPEYDFNDQSIPVGIEYFLNLVSQELGQA